MKTRILEKLKSPIGLAVQGFALGSLLFLGLRSAPDQTDPVPESGMMKIIVNA